MDVDDIAFSCSLFSDKVDNRDGLNQLHADGCIWLHGSSWIWGPTSKEREREGGEGRSEERGGDERVGEGRKGKRREGEGKGHEPPAHYLEEVYAHGHGQPVYCCVSMLACRFE